LREQESDLRDSIKREFDVSIFKFRHELHEFTRIIMLTIKIHELKSDLSDFIGVIFHFQFV